VLAADRRRAGAVRRLTAAGCVAAAEEADEMLAATPDDDTLETWLSRRERGEPLAWITGSTTFCGRAVLVSEGVYVPRIQSEELARRAAVLLPSGGSALDLCTGAGAVAVHLKAEVPSGFVVGVERDPKAATCARRNGVPAVIADLAEAIRPGRSFDVVTAVAPYVPTAELRLLPSDVQRYEPALALDGGDEGLDVVRRVVIAAGALLKPGGWLLIELGADQDEQLADDLTNAGLRGPTPWWDEDGDLRGLAAQAAR
jgi:release factor glutamine methyltransferase